MTIAKFEAYQHAIKTVQTRILDPELDLARGRYDLTTAKFVLDYISQQNKHMIVTLKKIQQAGYELPNTNSSSYKNIMHTQVTNIDRLIRGKTKYQMKFLKKFSSFLLITASLMTIAGCATLVLGTLLACIIQLLTAILFAVSAYKMGQKTSRYMNGPWFRYPKLDRRIVKNWDDNTCITTRARGHKQVFTAEQFKSVFSKSRFFHQDKTLADLVEEQYQLQIQR